VSTNPLALPHAAPKGVSRNQRHHRDAEELIQSKSAVSVGVAIYEREGDTSQVVVCNGCGGGVVVWRDDR
jgi:hypothetical protein